jgi:hypothetical protein
MRYILIKFCFLGYIDDSPSVNSGLRTYSTQDLNI